VRIGSMEADLFQVEGWMRTRTGGRTDMTKLTIALHSWANAPKTQDKYAQRRHYSMNDIRVLYEIWWYHSGFVSNSRLLV